MLIVISLFFLKDLPERADADEELHSRGRTPTKSPSVNSEERRSSETHISPAHIKHEPREGKYESQLMHHRHHRQDHGHKHLSPPAHKSHRFLPLPPPPASQYAGQNIRNKVSPHPPHHGSDYYSPIVYMPEHHHHRHPYSPTDQHYSHKERHYTNQHSHQHHDPRDRQREVYKHHYPSPNFMAASHRQHYAEGNSMPDHDSQKSKILDNASTSPGEKKKMISRNVDRKKLSEEELEELRRRERDYQRERRARIRLEKV